MHADTPRESALAPCGHSDLESAVTAQNDGLKGSFHSSSSSSLTLSLPSSKSIISQPFIEKCISEVVRIGVIIIFHLRRSLNFITHGSERVKRQEAQYLRLVYTYDAGTSTSTSTSHV